MLFSENDLSKEEIDQELEDTRSKACNNEERCEISEQDLIYYSKGNLIDKRWDNIEKVMKLETLKPYNLGKHNCCTVTYKAAATLFSSEKELHTKVDPTTFNIYGSGVVWSNFVLSSSWSFIELFGKDKQSLKKISDDYVKEEL
jgi:hypothetical protein